MSANPVTAYNKFWDPGTLSWVFAQQAVIEAGTVNVQGPLSVSGPLTDAELRAADVKVTLDGESVAVTGPLTDTQLRATPVPVSGTFYPETQPVSGAFYPATQPVSVVSLPLPSGAATESSVAALTKPSDSQHATLDDVAMELRLVLQAINYPGWLDRSANQIRAQVTGSAAVSGNLTTVTNLTNLGSFTGDHLQRQANYAAWQLTVRARIT